MNTNLATKISQYFQTGTWKMKYDELTKNEQFTNQILIDQISNYQSKTVLNKKLIKGYLGQNKKHFYIQNELTKFLFDLDKDEFIRILKFNRLFETDFYQEIISPIKENEKIKELSKQISVIKKENERIKELKEEIELKLIDYEFYQLLFNLATWIDHKYIEQIKNSSQNIAIQPYYTQSVSFVLQIKQRILKKHKQRIEGLPPEQVQERFYNFLKYFADNYEKWLPFEALMLDVIDIIHWQDILEHYVYQNARLIIIDYDKYSIIPSSPEDETIWKKNEMQQIYLERFYYNESKNYVSIFQRLNPFIKPLDFSHKIEFFFNGIPDEIEFNNKKINPYHILLFFEGLNAFHSDRYYQKLINLSKENHKENIFQTIIKTIESENLWYKPMMGALNITNIDYLINRIKNKVNFDIPINNEEIKNVFDFITYDLENVEDARFNILEQPFLKFKEKYFYFTTVITANNPAFIIENRILKQDKNIRKEYEEKVSKNFEKLISDIFSKYGFNTKVGVNIPNTKENKRTDIDVLVWKDNELLIVQAKKTYRRIKVSEIETYNTQLEKAAEQIKTSIKYIENNTENFLKQNKISIEPDKLKIFGLIISNTVEGNLKTYGDNHYHKITATELAIILDDKKNYIVNWQFEALAEFLNSKEKARERFAYIQPKIIRAAQIIKEKELKIKFNNLSLWKDKGRTISNLMEIIEQNILWNDILDVEIDLPPKDASKDELLAHYLFFEGKRYFEQKQYEKSKSIFEKAYKLNPKDRDIRMYYADSLAETGEKEQAIKHYTEIIKDYPEYWLAYSNRAATYIELKRKEEAFNDYTEVLKLDPSNIQAYIAILYLHENFKFELPDLPNINEIMRNFTTVEDERIQNSLLLYPIKELAKLEEKAKTNKLDYEETLMLINFYMELGQYRNEFSKATETIEKALQNFPDDPKFILIKAWIYKTQNKIQEGIELCMKTLETNENESELLRVLGELYLAQKDKVKATEYYIKAINIDNNNFYAHYNLAMIHKENGKFNEAIAELKQATKTEKPDWKILFYKELYTIYKEMNDYDNALNTLKELIKLGDYAFVREWNNLNLLKLLNDYTFNNIYYY